MPFSRTVRTAQTSWPLQMGPVRTSTVSSASRLTSPARLRRGCEAAGLCFLPLRRLWQQAREPQWAVARRPKSREVIGSRRPKQRVPVPTARLVHCAVDVASSTCRTSAVRCLPDTCAAALRPYPHLCTTCASPLARTPWRSGPAALHPGSTFQSIRSRAWPSTVRVRCGELPNDLKELCRQNTHRHELP